MSSSQSYNMRRFQPVVNPRAEGHSTKQQAVCLGTSLQERQGSTQAGARPRTVNLDLSSMGLEEHEGYRRHSPKPEEGRRTGGSRLEAESHPGCETGFQATEGAAGASVMRGVGGETECRRGSHRGGDLQRLGFTGWGGKEVPLIPQCFRQ